MAQPAQASSPASCNTQRPCALASVSNSRTSTGEPLSATDSYSRSANVVMDASSASPSRPSTVDVVASTRPSRANNLPAQGLGGGA
jgi:hypothetical protein